MTAQTIASSRRVWIARRVADALILAAGVALALPLILPFA
jgi:hypothetical protein